MSRNPIKSLAGQTVVYGMGTIVPRLLNYLLVPVYTRLFQDQATYGQITELYAYVAFLLVLLTYGMETAFFRFAQKHSPSKIFNNATSSIILTTGIFVLFSTLFFNDFARWLHYDGNSSYILLVALIVAFDTIAAIPFAMLRKQNKARKFAIVRLVNVAVNLFLNFLTIIWFPEYFTKLGKILLGPETGLVVWVFISNLLASALSLGMLSETFRNFRFTISKEILKPMLQYAWPILIIGLAGMVNEMLDKILLKYLIPAEKQPMAQLGIYGANYKLGVLMTLFIQMFRYAAEPFFFAEAENKNAPELFARVMNYFVISGLIIFLGVTLFMDVFKLFIGPGYREGLHIVPIILMANLFNGIYYNLAIWYKLTDRTGSGAIIAVGGALMTIVLNFALIPPFGYYGAAWATLIVYLLMMLCSFFWGQRVYFIPYNSIRILVYFALALAVYHLCGMLNVQQVAIRLILNTLGLLLFSVLAFWIEACRNRLPARMENAGQ